MLNSDMFTSVPAGSCCRYFSTGMPNPSSATSPAVRCSNRSKGESGRRHRLIGSNRFFSMSVSSTGTRGTSCNPDLTLCTKGAQKGIFASSVPGCNSQALIDRLSLLSARAVLGALFATVASQSSANSSLSRAFLSLPSINASRFAVRSNCAFRGVRKPEKLESGKVVETGAAAGAAPAMGKATATWDVPAPDPATV